MRTKNIILALILSLLTHTLCAQHTETSVSGIVTDTKGEILEGVAILLRLSSDSSYVSGVVTNTNGVFILSPVIPQKYLLEYSMLGYTKQYSSIRVNANEHQILDPVVMAEDAQQLSNVTVTAQRILMKMDPGKTIFSMDAMIVGSQGSILDALRSLPGVMVNEDGTVVLNGQTGIQVLVNGKSTYLSGDKLVNYLRSMPISSIKDIELITSPSAKYDAAGKTGLIDIRTQKVITEGWVLQANSGYQQSADGKWNVGGRFTYQRNKLGIFLDYSHNQGEYKSTLDITREFNAPDPESSPRFNIWQNSRMKDHSQGDWARVGLSYDINDKFSIEASTSGALFSNRIPGNTSAFLQAAKNRVDSTLYTHSLSHTKQQVLSGGTLLNYTDENERTADISFDYLFHLQDGNISMLNEMRNPAEQVLGRDTLKGDIDSDIRMYSTQANWGMPLPGKFKFYSGVKFTWVNMDNKALYTNQVSGQWLPNNNLSSQYGYTENINAAYIQVNGLVKKFNFDAGLRMEQTRLSGMDSYFHLFPSFTVQYEIPKTKNSVSFLYNRRIIRPTYRDLSSFSYIWDDYTRSTGNPNLKPEFTDNLELAYIHQKAFRVTLFFSHTKDPIMQSIEIANDNVGVVHPENFKNNARIGLRMDASDLIRKSWWRMGINATLYHSRYKWNENETTIEKKLFTPSVSVNNQFILPAGINAEASGFYNGRMAFGQATIDPHWSVSVAIQKKVWDDRLTIRLFANDLFQSNRQNLNLDLSQKIGKVTTKQFNDYRCIGLSLSIQLKQGQQSKKSTRDTSIDQSKRINL